MKLSRIEPWYDILAETEGRISSARRNRFERYRKKLLVGLLAERALDIFSPEAKPAVHKNIRDCLASRAIGEGDLLEELIRHPELKEIADRFPGPLAKDPQALDMFHSTPDQWRELLQACEWERGDGDNRFTFPDGRTVVTPRRFVDCRMEGGQTDLLFFRRDEAGQCFWERVCDRKTFAYDCPDFFADSRMTGDERPDRLRIDEQVFLKAEKVAECDAWQRSAITHDMERNVVVLAGAGSGKTRTLSHRFCYLNLVKGIAHDKILMLTFTTNAAQQMEEKTLGFINEMRAAYDYPQLTHLRSRTIDSFIMEELRERWEYAGFTASPRFEISTADDLRHYFYHAVSEIRSTLPIALMDGYQRSKDAHKQLFNRLDLVAKGKPVHDENVEAVFSALVDKQRRENLILGFPFATTFFRNMLRNPSYAEELERRFSCILVDEYQDIDQLQHEIFAALFDRDIHFFMVGDDDQSIYGWRGTDNRYIRQIAEDKRFERIVLKTNYRNNPYVVKAGNCILGHIADRTKSKDEIIPHLKGGSPVRVAQTSPGYTGLTGEIARLIRGGVQPHRICVLARNRAPLRDIVSGLHQAGIKTAGEPVGRHPPPEYRMLKAVLLLSLGAPLAEHAAVIREQLQLEDATDQRIALAARGQGPREGGILSEIAEAMASLSSGRQTGLEEAIAALRSRLAHVHAWSLHVPPLDEEAVLELYDYCKDMRLVYPDNPHRIASALKRFEKMLARSAQRAVEGRVYCDTVHRAKGLEYDTVFVVGLQAGEYPNHRQMERKHENKKKALERCLRAPRKRDEVVRRLRSAENLAARWEDEVRRAADVPGLEAITGLTEDFEGRIDDILALEVDAMNELVERYNDHVVPLTARYGAVKCDAENLQRMLHYRLRQSPGDAVLTAELERQQQLAATAGQQIQAVSSKLQLTTAIYTAVRRILSLNHEVLKANNFDAELQRLEDEHKAEIEEEKRVFYVAITRAARLLYLCHAQGTTPSEFITWIHPSLRTPYDMLSESRHQAQLMMKERLAGQLKDELDPGAADAQMDELLGSFNLDGALAAKAAKEAERLAGSLGGLSATEMEYARRAERMRCIATTLGMDFDMEIAHTLFRMCEERLSSYPDPETTVPQGLPEDTLDALHQTLRSELARAHAKAFVPSPKVLADVFGLRKQRDISLSDERLRSLKPLGLLHYIFRHVKPGVMGEEYAGQWDRFPSHAAAVRFLSAAHAVSDIRNRYVHKVREQWRSDDVRRLEENVRVLFEGCPRTAVEQVEAAIDT